MLFLNSNCTQRGDAKGDNMLIDQFQPTQVEVHTINVVSGEATHI